MGLSPDANLDAAKLVRSSGGWTVRELIAKDGDNRRFDTIFGQISTVMSMTAAQHQLALFERESPRFNILD